MGFDNRHGELSAWYIRGQVRIHLPGRICRRGRLISSANARAPRYSAQRPRFSLQGKWKSAPRLAGALLLDLRSRARKRSGRYVKTLSVVFGEDTLIARAIGAQASIVRGRTGAGGYYACDQRAYSNAADRGGRIHRCAPRQPPTRTPSRPATPHPPGGISGVGAYRNIALFTIISRNETR